MNTSRMTRLVDVDLDSFRYSMGDSVVRGNYMWGSVATYVLDPVHSPIAESLQVCVDNSMWLRTNGTIL